MTQTEDHRRRPRRSTHAALLHPEQRRGLAVWAVAGWLVVGCLLALLRPTVLGPPPLPVGQWMRWAEASGPGLIGVNLLAVGALIAATWVSGISLLALARLLPNAVAVRLPGVPRSLRLLIAETAVVATAFAPGAGALAPPPPTPIIVDAGGHRIEPSQWASDQAQRVWNDVGAGPVMGLQRLAPLPPTTSLLDDLPTETTTTGLSATTSPSEAAPVVGAVGGAGWFGGAPLGASSTRDSVTGLSVPASHASDSAEVWEVKAGEHFWAIAEHVVGLRSGPSTQEQVREYWLRLIEANRQSLVEPGNPDLIMPGQVFVLPA